MLFFFWRYGLNGFILVEFELVKGFFSKWYMMIYLVFFREFFLDVLVSLCWGVKED